MASTSAPPSIGIDGYNLALPHGTGVATYGNALAEAIRALGLGLDGIFGVPVGRDPTIRDVHLYEAIGRGMPARQSPKWLRPTIDRWALFKGLPLYPVHDRGLVELRGFEDRFPRFDRMYSAALLFERAHLHFRSKRRFLTVRLEDPPAIMHWTYPVPVRIAGSRNIYTLHDLVPLKLPFATLDTKRVYHRVIEGCVSGGAHIVTVSESSRNDILAMFDASPDRVTNTYQHAPVPPTAMANDGEDVTGVFGLRQGGFFLYFGAIEPKKNIPRLIEAFLSVETDAPLVIVGARAWQKDEELRLMEAVGRSGGAGARRIVQLDYLPRRLLMKLAAAAKAVLFPSLYEGFGLPVLEAMQLGTPVVTSIMGSLPEVAGDSALLVDAYDVPALAEAIRRIDTDPALRARLSAAGRRQAARFSLDRHRRALHDVYTRVLAAPARLV
jgi:glycosyltransferase involved in cell wall biosynthesis